MTITKFVLIMVRKGGYVMNNNRQLRVKMVDWENDYH